MRQERKKVSFVAHMRVLVANEGVQTPSSFAVRATRPRAITSIPYKRKVGFFVDVYVSNFADLIVS